MVTRSLAAAEVVRIGSAAPVRPLPQFRETPLPPAAPPQPPRRRKKLPKPIGKEEELAEISAALEAVDQANQLVGCLKRQAFGLRAAIGRDASQHGEHILLAVDTMAASAIEKLKAARSKLNTLETLELHGSYIAVRP